jgi:hypothetical protein
LDIWGVKLYRGSIERSHSRYDKETMNSDAEGRIR